MNGNERKRALSRNRSQRYRKRIKIFQSDNQNSDENVPSSTPSTSNTLPKNNDSVKISGWEVSDSFDEPEIHESPTESNEPEQLETNAYNAEFEPFYFVPRPLELANFVESRIEDGEESEEYYSHDDYDFDDDIDISDNDIIFDEREEIKKWAIDSNIPLKHLSKLLLILRHRLLPDLPKTAQTFLKTNSARYIISSMGDGEFAYFGLENSLKTCIDSDLHEDEINLQINIDGLPLHKSSKEQFWPILAKPFHIPDVYKPFPVAIYCGSSKPPLNLFLNNFVDEFNRLHEEGLIVNEKHLKVNIQCFICDTPARAYVKNILGHGGKEACERCTVSGVRYKNRTIYPVSEYPARTDESFRNKECSGHHNGDTPILNIPSINIITIFILDFMHLCTLGVMKKLLVYWLNDLRYKISLTEKQKLSERLEAFKNEVPLEFNRKPRSVSDIGMWKATEFLYFLLYYGPIVLSDILSETKFKHFLLFHMACRILCAEKYAIIKNNRAKYYLQLFADSAPSEYDLDILVINLHNLIHMADDAINMNCCLNYLTAFPFEGFLGELKLMLRSKYRPLPQICRRLYEKYVVQNQIHEPKVKKPLSIAKCRIGQDGISHVTKLRFHGTTLTTTRPNNFILLKDKSVFEIKDMIVCRNQINLTGGNVIKKRPIFQFPCNSARYDMHELEDQMTAEFQITIDDVEQKLVRLTVKKNNCTKIYVSPLLH